VAPPFEFGKNMFSKNVVSQSGSTLRYGNSHVSKYRALLFILYVLSICYREAYFIALIVELIMRRHLIFLAFIIMIFILALVVKLDNDRKKFEVFNEVETTSKFIQKKP